MRVQNLQLVTVCVNHYYHFITIQTKVFPYNGIPYNGISWKQ